jgi:hypothetical protein
VCFRRRRKRRRRGGGGEASTKREVVGAPLQLALFGESTKEEGRRAALAL